MINTYRMLPLTQISVSCLFLYDAYYQKSKQLPRQSRPLPIGEVVDSCKLNECREDKGKAHGDEPVHGGGVGHLGQGVASADAQGGHGEHGVGKGAVEKLWYYSELTVPACKLLEGCASAKIAAQVNVYKENSNAILTSMT
ncbi:hypothetical protein EK904_002195 [Melospiza melodia maxima]|nr:hypothetical protein EK904_002195 [Melospiza melodia maxima]